jgi:hypothetical protein
MHFKEVVKTNNILPLRPEDFKAILNGIEPDAILIGGQALALWVHILNIKIDNKIRNEFNTKDADFLGSLKSLKGIQKSWAGEIFLMHKRSLSSLIGQVKKFFPEEDAYRSIDVLHHVLGFSINDIKKSAITIQYENIQFKIHHPLEVLKARLVNVSEIKDKQNVHGVLQIEYAIKVAYEYLSRLINETYKKQLEDTNKRPQKLLEEINKLSKLAMNEKLQGTAKAYNLDVLDAFPIVNLQKIKGIELFFEKRWPQIQTKANAIPIKQKLEPLVHAIHNSKKEKTSKAFKL